MSEIQTTYEERWTDDDEYDLTAIGDCDGGPERRLERQVLFVFFVSRESVQTPRFENANWQKEQSIVHA